MHPSLFSELSLIIAIAAGVALVMRAIRQPLIIGHILTGMIVGPSILHLVKSAETIEVFSNIGIALLLFIIGLGLNPRVIKEVGKVSAITGLLQVGSTALLGWSAAVILGFTTTESIFIGTALSFSSTIIILKLLSDKKEQARLYGKVATGLLLVQDLLATFALLFVTSRSSGGFSIEQLGELFGKGLLIAIPLMAIGNLVLPRFSKLIAGNQELLFLFAIGWGFGSAALFEISGFSLEVGALLGGIALASLPYTQEISARLRPLRDFFIVVFFISLGTRLNFNGLSDIMPAVISASVIVVFFKPLIVLIIMGLLGYTKRTSFKTSIAMAQLSEFSLIFIFLGNKQGLLSDHIVAIMTMTALISIACSTYLILYSDKIFSILERYLDLFERRKAQFEHEARRPHYDLVLFGYQKGGHEFVKVFEGLKKSFVVIDYDPEVIDNLETQKTNYLYGDAQDIELLEEAGLDKTKLVVSTISDYATSTFLIKLMEDINPSAVVILHAENIAEASELYELGASYVIIPHYIGSEKIGSFIKKNGFKKSEYKKYREKHLAYLQSHYDFVNNANV